MLVLKLWLRFELSLWLGIEIWLVMVRVKKLLWSVKVRSKVRFALRLYLGLGLWLGLLVPRNTNP